MSCFENKNNEYNRESFIRAVTDYFRSGENAPSDFLMGIELEHFVVRRDDSGAYRRVRFDGDDGIESILWEAADICKAEGLDIKSTISKGHIIGFSSADYSITLEPGAQLEVSIRPVAKVQEARDIYDSFYRLFEPLFSRRKYELVNCSYSPDSSGVLPPLIPKMRYDRMDKWFDKTGSMGKEMMRNTCATQVTFDYKDEDDFVRKYRKAVLLTEEILERYDNPPVIAGRDPAEYRCIRKKIWDNVDKDRCSLPDGIFTDSFGYRSYAEYLWDIVPLVIEEKCGEEISCIDTGDKTAGCLWQSGVLKQKDIPHLLSMVFPPVRLRNYIEIRYADSLPADAAFEYMERMKGAMYA